MARAIGIVGSGRVAQALGRLLCDAGEPIVAVASRTLSNAQHAATFMGCGVRAVACEDLPGIVTDLLVATSDDGVTAAAQTLRLAGFKDGAALHTSGSQGPEALAPLRGAGVACGVLHPLQTIANPTQGVGDLQRATFALAGDSGAIAWGREIIALAHGRELSIDAGRMREYHASAVMAGNAVIAVIDAAARLLTAAGVCYQDALDAIGPLCRTSLENSLQLGPGAALTGPIARGDAATVASHLDALAMAPPDVAALYRAAGLCLVDLARRRDVPAKNLDAIATALATVTVGGSDGRPSSHRH